MDKNAAIGVFDSGVGGLTVAREIMRQLPEEKIIYFGDTARIPYGSKSKDKRYLAWRREIIDASDERIFMHENWCSTCDDDRDRYMVDNCDKLIAIFDGINAGGVYKTIQYAKSIGKEVIFCPAELVRK